MTPATSTRLPAAERRQALIDIALEVFTGGSYRGTTTAEIAREAGVSEPILYRHFDSKRDLYLACIDESWRRLRAVWEEAIAGSQSPSEWLPAMAGSSQTSSAAASKQARSIKTATPRPKRGSSSRAASWAQSAAD